MSGSTTFAGIKYAEAADEINKFPVNVSEPGAKTIDAYLEEHTLSYKTRAASFEAKSGELSECTKALTVTLPAATVNRLVGVVNIPAVAGELVKITTSGGAFIIGDFITAASKTATITLTEGQHVLLFASGTNWFIVAGEPKREQVWSAQAPTVSGEEREASATRLAMVRVIATGEVEKTLTTTITIGGVALGGGKIGAVAGVQSAIAETFLVPPGLKWKIEATNAFSLKFSNLLL